MRQRKDYRVAKADDKKREERKGERKAGP